MALMRFEKLLPMACRLKVLGRDDEKFRKAWRREKRKWYDRDSIPQEVFY
jgi:hypothetical protein